MTVNPLTTATPVSAATGYIVALLAVTTVFVAMQLYLTLPLTPVFAHVFGVTLPVAAWASTAYGLAYAGANLIFGALSDRYGRLAVIVPGLLALAIVTLLAGMSPSFSVLVLARIAQGVAVATFPSVALAYLGETLNPEMRGTGIAVVNVALLLAGLAGQMYGAFVESLFGWRWVFFAVVPIYAVAVLLIVRLPRTQTPAADISLGQVFVRMLQHLSNRKLLAAYAAAFTLLFTFVAMYAGLDASARTTHGASDPLLRLSGVPGILLTPFIAGPLMRRLSNVTLISIAFMTAALGLAAEAMASATQTLLFGSGVFVLGVAIAGPPLVSLIGTLGAKARGAAIALYASILFLGAGLGPIYAAWFRNIGFTPLCWSLGGIAMGAALVIHGAREALVLGPSSRQSK
jgi:predicted MFS family arabinose efflux permease